MFLKHQNNKNDSRIKVTVANQFFVSQKLNLLLKFDEITENYFNAKVQKMDFKKSNETSKEINEIFNQKTNGQIKNITKPSEIKPDLAVRLINALQFSAKWKNIFRTPKKQTFYSYDCSREIDMFHRQVMEKCQWNYIQNDESCVLGIPYENNSAWMYTVLPNEKNGLQKIVENLKPENFYEWTKRSPNPYVIVRIPVMEISNEFELKESLQKLGIKDAFEEDICNLTKMIEGPSKVDKIIHKTVMKTDEYGTEATAATSIYDLRCGGRIARFKADHPFLFFITTNKPKDFKPINILFIVTILVTVFRQQFSWRCF